MILMVAFVLTFSAVLLEALTSLSLGKFTSDKDTDRALAETKAALIGWAVSHPDLPGMMPYPDRAETTSPNYDGNSDCFPAATAFSYTFLIGEVPWHGQTSPCVAPLTGLGVTAQDATGERLWYAVSRNLVYDYASPGHYPLVNSTIVETPPYPWLTVRDANGTIVSDRVAVVIMDPGPPLEGQDRSGAAPPASSYLDTLQVGSVLYRNDEFNGCPDSVTTCTSPTGAEDFIMAPASETFNDRVAYITIDELMTQVQRRVLGEVALALQEYKTKYGRYPWLSPFVDPTPLSPYLEGTAGTGSGTGLLVDPGRNFTSSGVRVGDRVLDESSGVQGTVTSVGTPDDATLGVDLSFASGDVYRILAAGRTVYGTADLASSGTTLEDATKSFVDLEVHTGDVVEDLASGAAGMVQAVTPTTLTVDRLTGGASSYFTPGDSYRIRGAFGRMTGLTSNTTDLNDTGQDFVGLGVKSGDIIQTLSDGARGVVATTPTSPTDLSVTELVGGVTDQFIPDDAYMLPRFSGSAGMRVGHLAFHDLGEAFATGFDVSWSISPATGTVCSQLTDEYRLDHKTSLNAALPTGNYLVPAGSGTCTWVDTYTVACTGGVAVTAPSSPASGSTPSGVPLCDTSAPEVDPSLDPINTRLVSFRFNFSGPSTGPVADASGGKVRDVCLGYTTPCSTVSAGGSSIPLYTGNEVTITVQDLDGSGTVLGRDVLALTGAAPGTGSLRVAGIHFDLERGVELPAWLVNEDWHELLYVAIAGNEAPGGSDACHLSGTGCLTLKQSGLPGAPIRNDVEALVIAAGPPLASQNRASGTACSAPAPPFMCDYLEGDNKNEDDTFEVNDPSSTFNDQIRVVAP